MATVTTEDETECVGFPTNPNTHPELKQLFQPLEQEGFPIDHRGATAIRSVSSRQLREMVAQRQTAFLPRHGSVPGKDEPQQTQRQTQTQADAGDRNLEELVACFLLLLLHTIFMYVDSLEHNFCRKRTIGDGRTTRQTYCRHKRIQKRPFDRPPCCFRQLFGSFESINP